jgi:hypothetical protein
MIYWTKIIAWAATILCAGLSARSAAVFAKHSPRVFTILALFSLNWAILIPYYSEINPSELLDGFSGFLLVYVGVLLHREALNPLRSNTLPPSGFSNSSMTEAPINTSSSEYTLENSAHNFLPERIALKLFILLIAPSALGLPLPQNIGLKALKIPYTAPVVSTFITVLGYYAVCRAIGIYSTSKKGWRWLCAIAGLYATTEVAFLLRQLYILAHPVVSNLSSAELDFWRIQPSPPLTPLFLVLFAVHKLLFTILVISLVLKESLSPGDLSLSNFERILKFFGVPVPA